MAASSVTLNDDSAAPVNFRLQASDMKTARYIDPLSTLSLPMGFEVVHDIKPPSSLGTDRHTLRFFNTIKDSVTGVQATPVISLQLSVPRSVTVDASTLYNLRAFIIEYLSKSNLDLLVDGVTP